MFSWSLKDPHNFKIKFKISLVCLRFSYLWKSCSLCYWMYMLWFNFILGSNLIFLCFKLIIIHYNTQKTKESKIWTKDKTEPQHIQRLCNYLVWSTFSWVPVVIHQKERKIHLRVVWFIFKCKHRCIHDKGWLRKCSIFMSKIIYINWTFWMPRFNMIFQQIFFITRN